MEYTRPVEIEPISLIQIQTILKEDRGLLTRAKYNERVEQELLISRYHNPNWAVLKIGIDPSSKLFDYLNAQKRVYLADHGKDDSPSAMQFAHSLAKDKLEEECKRLVRALGNRLDQTLKGKFKNHIMCGHKAGITLSVPNISEDDSDFLAATIPDVIKAYDLADEDGTVTFYQPTVSIGLAKARLPRFEGNNGLEKRLEIVNGLEKESERKFRSAREEGGNRVIY